jgi:hypothetical protein
MIGFLETATGLAPWQITDVLALAKVCFEGRNGHGADAGQCPLMTRSRTLTAVQLGFSLRLGSGSTLTLSGAISLTGSIIAVTPLPFLRCGFEPDGGNRRHHPSVHQRGGEVRPGDAKSVSSMASLRSSRGSVTPRVSRSTSSRARSSCSWVSSGGRRRHCRPPITRQAASNTSSIRNSAGVCLREVMASLIS